VNGLSLRAGYSELYEAVQVGNDVFNPKVERVLAERAGRRCDPVSLTGTVVKNQCTLAHLGLTA
jgi:hypothetical protein